ncbi:MAG: succinylglutamate desuccinylase/aspartoacylase family protein [Leptolyngbyaceae cyanobacterium bins.302]|nr:succinylglutamate desuccinylase/aspartoacylase family protein [Leptolyngbyaceae cyanobacterium bins.302]
MSQSGFVKEEGAIASYARAISTFAQSATTYTGDTIQGVPVISQLDINDLEPGQKHRFFFQGVQMGTGQHWYVPIVVAKGMQSGRSIGLLTGVHGDEVSSIDAVQRIMANLDPIVMSGNAIAVYGISRPAMEYTQSKWHMAQGGGLWVDMNRVWPGNELGEDAPTRHAGLLWNRLFKGNIDLAIDYHTVSTGSDFTMFIFADLQKPDIRQMAELFPVEQIKDDSGLSGTLETALVEAGIPALTVEIGSPRIFDARKIAMTVEGSMNVFKHYQVITGAIARTSKDAGTFFGDAFETIRSTSGGFLEMLVDIKDPVVPGQKVAIQRNAFGDTVAEYSASVAGEVATIARDALSEPGSRVMQILYNSTHPLTHSPTP